MHLQEGRSDREALPLTCAEYRMNSRCHDLLRAKKLCKRTSRVTPITVDPRCAPAAANQCPPAASITAPGSAKPCRWWLAATRNAHAPNAWQTDTNRRRHVWFTRSRVGKDNYGLSKILQSNGALFIAFHCTSISSAI